MYMEEGSSWENNETMNNSNYFTDIVSSTSATIGNLSVLVLSEMEVEEEEEEKEDWHIFENPHVRTVLLVVYSVLFFFCFFGNLMVVLVTAFHPRMKSITKFCLSNLATANLCVAIFCVYPNLFMYLYTRWLLGNFMCKMYHFTNSLSHTASVLILVVMAIERYVAILHPFKCRSLLTAHRLRLTIFGVWILSALICSPRLYYIETIQHPFPSTNKGYEVICIPTSNLYDFETTDMIQFVGLYIAPLVIITILYTRVGLFLRKRDERRNSLMNASLHPEEKVVGEDPLNYASTQSFRTTSNNNNPSPTLPSPSSGTANAHGTTRAQRNSSKKLTHHVKVTKIRVNVSRAPSGDGLIGSSTAGGGRKRWRSKSISIHHPHKAVVRMLITVVATFALCNLPFHLRKIYQNYLYHYVIEGDWTELSAPITYLLMYANCAINPYVYGFMSKSFRTCLVEFLTCRMRRRIHFFGRGRN